MSIEYAIRQATRLTSPKPTRFLLPCLQPVILPAFCQFGPSCVRIVLRRTIHLNVAFDLMFELLPANPNANFDFDHICPGDCEALEAWGCEAWYACLEPRVAATRSLRGFPVLARCLSEIQRRRWWYAVEMYLLLA